MGIVKRIIVPLTVILVIGTVIFVAVYFSTRGGTSKNLGKYRPRPLESYNWCGNRKVVALTFDDGPEPSTTPALLAALKRHDVKATFFMSPAVNGPPNNQHCVLVKDVLKHGHSVQSHSYDHSNYMDKDGSGIQANLETNHQWLKKCADGKKLSLSQFRPPFGSLDVARAKFASDLGYTLATWNIESLDYTGTDAQQTFANVYFTTYIYRYLFFPNRILFHRFRPDLPRSQLVEVLSLSCTIRSTKASSDSCSHSHSLFVFSITIKVEPWVWWIFLYHFSRIRDTNL